MQKVKIPHENGGIFFKQKSYQDPVGEEHPDKINNPIVVSWENKSYVIKYPI
jgi:hypothetical protein